MKKYIILLILMTVQNALPGDRVYMKAGNVLKGKVEASGASEIRLRLSIGELTIPKEKIDKIVIEEETLPPVKKTPVKEGAVEPGAEKDSENTAKEPAQASDSPQEPPDPALPAAEIERLLSRIATDTDGSRSPDRITTEELGAAREKLYAFPVKELGAYLLEKFPAPVDRVNAEILLYFQEKDYKKAGPRLMKMYHSFSPATRMQAIPVISMTGGSEVFAFFKSIYDSADLNEKKRMIPLMQNFEGQEVVTLLADCLDHENWWVRGQAKEVLWNKIRTKKDTEFIAEKLIANLRPRRKSTLDKVKLLSGIETEACVQTLYRTALSGNKKEREACLRALAEMKLSSARKKLYFLLKLKRDKYTMACLSAIKQSPRKGDILPVIECLETDKTGIRKNCQLILTRLTGVNHGIRKADWLNWYENSESEQ